MNVICVSGTMCKDTELKYTKNNKSVLENTIAVPKGIKNKDGQYESDFIDFVAFEKKAEYLNQYAKKGDKVEISGKLRVDSWKDDDGNYKSRTYVVADDLKIMASSQKKNESPF